MRPPNQHLLQAWPDHFHQKHQQLALRQVQPPDFDPSSLNLQPSSTSHHHGYLQAIHLVQPRALAEAVHQRAEEADRRPSEALAEVGAVRNLLA